MAFMLRFSLPSSLTLVCVCTYRPDLMYILITVPPGPVFNKACTDVCFFVLADGYGVLMFNPRL